MLWTYAEKDPIYSNLKWQGTFSGARSIHMLSPLWKKPNFSHNANNRETRQWDVTVKNVSCFFFFVCILIQFGGKCAVYDISREIIIIL